MSDSKHGRQVPSDDASQSNETGQYDSSDDASQNNQTSPDPDQQLKDLKKQLEHDQTEIDKLTKDKDTLKEDISALENVVNAIKQILSAYNQALPNLKKEQRDANTYFETKMRMIECAIGENREKIDQKIQGFDKYIDEREKEVKDLEKR